MNVYVRCDSRIKSNLVNSFVTATTMPPTLTVALGLGWVELHSTISLKSIVEHVGTFFFSFFAQVGNGHNWCSPYKQWQAQHGNDPYAILELQVGGKPWTSCGQKAIPCSASKNLLHNLHEIEYHCSRKICLSFRSHDVQLSTISIFLLICRAWATWVPQNIFISLLYLYLFAEREQPECRKISLSFALFLSLCRTWAT